MPLLLLTAAVSAPAIAAPQLVSATPAADASVAAPSTIELRLSEKLATAASGAKLTMTAMPGMKDHPPMQMPVATSIGADGMTILLKPSKKLPTGSYRVDWHAAGADAVRADGSHSFSVR